MAKNVTVIPATLNLHTGALVSEHRKRKVAGYARVSTDSEEQLTSYEAQVDYYTNYIKGNLEWDFAGVYTDEGISATNTKKRDGFNKMITDALAGKIDLIVTKSVSRFARNTVDSLTTVRKLKEKGVEAYFQKENIYTLDSKGELLITIMSSLAQEESRSISENVTWGQRKRFADGKISLPYKSFLGYKKGEDGLPEIVPEQAEIVRRIYKSFMQGKTTCAIARELTADGIPTPGGKTKWQSSTVESILQNEKYKGDALLQKKYTVDFLQKKMKINEGEVPQYYVENSHPPIIDPNEWEMVQTEFLRRKEIGRHYSSSSIFASTIVCGDCGARFGSKVWHSNSKYRRTIWQCNDKFKGNNKCRTPHLYDEDIARLFLSAFGQLVSAKEQILEDCRLVQDTICDCAELNAEQDAVTEEMAVVSELIRHCIEENSNKAQNQAEYLERYNLHIKRYEKLKKKYETIESERQRRKEQYDRLAEFMFLLTEQEYTPLEFSEDLWLAMVDVMTVNVDENVVFKFKGGMEITEQL